MKDEKARSAKLCRPDASQIMLRFLSVPMRVTAAPAAACLVRAVAEFENDIRRERQRDGVERAKDCGVCQGRPATIAPHKIAALAADGLGATAIAAALEISGASVNRLGEKATSIYCDDRRYALSALQGDEAMPSVGLAS